MCSLPLILTLLIFYMHWVCLSVPLFTGFHCFSRMKTIRASIDSIVLCHVLRQTLSRSIKTSTQKNTTYNFCGSIRECYLFTWNKLKKVVIGGLNEYHLIPTPIFSSFKPPSVQKKKENIKTKHHHITL